MVQSKPHGDVIVRMRTRAFAGRMASHRVMVEPDGSIQVYDAIAGHYTRAHSMPKRDQTRARRLAAERVREQEEGSYTALEACIVDGEHPQPTREQIVSLGRHLGAEIARFTLNEDTCSLRWVGLEAQDVAQIPMDWDCDVRAAVKDVAEAEYRRIITEAIKAGKVSREEREESSRRAGNVDG